MHMLHEFHGRSGLRSTRKELRSRQPRRLLFARKHWKRPRVDELWRSDSAVSVTFLSLIVRGGMGSCIELLVSDVFFFVCVCVCVCVCACFICFLATSSSLSLSLSPSPSPSPSRFLCFFRDLARRTEISCENIVRVGLGSC